MKGKRSQVERSLTILLVLHAIPDLCFCLTEREALVSLYNSCHGESWNYASNWNTSADICTWVGITCDANLHVIKLDFLFSQPLIGEAGYKQCDKAGPTCVRGNNLICSPLPDAICSLSNLQYLDLTLNQISGPLPDCISSMITLRYLSFAENLLTGPLPNLSPLQSLTYLNLGDTCGMHSAYEYQYLADHIYHLPVAVAKQLMWGGPWWLPSSLCYMYFNLPGAQKNTFGTSWPSWLSSLPNLTYLNVQRSGLTGSFPEAADLPPAIQDLMISFNTLTGPIPLSWAQKLSLRTIIMSDNYASGSYPDAWSALTNLVFVDMGSQNTLQGPVPKSWASLTKLRSLSIAKSVAQDAIPEEWATLVNLEFVNFYQAGLIGPLPNAIGNWTKILALILGVNNFQQPIPQSWCTCKKMFNFAAFSAGITGGSAVPLRCWKALKRIELWGNPLNEPIPDEFNGFSQLSDVLLYQAGLYGPVPASLANLTTLQLLYLQKNQLSGPIPDIFWTMPVLSAVYLHHNQFTGGLPASLFNAKKLQTIYLQYNQLDGPLVLPTPATGLATLLTIDLSRNSFSGELPASLSSATALQILNLAYNNFSGAIPAQWRYLTALQELDLSNNRIEQTGTSALTIFKQLPQLSKLILNNNLLYRTIDILVFWSANSDVFWPSLIQLSLSNNRLVQALPAVIWTGLPKIISLDLSNNMFEGDINPDLTSLKVLRLTGNMLSSATNSLPSALITTDNYLLDSSGKFMCPQLQGTNHDLEVSLDPEYYGYSLCRCAASFYGTHGVCQSCMTGGRCEGGAMGELMIIRKGWAPSPNKYNISGLVKCFSDKSLKTACNPLESEDWSCEVGHEGRLCSKCAKDYYRYKNFCAVCPESATSFLVVVAIFMLIVLYTVAMIYFWSPGENALGTQARLLVQYLQTLDVATSSAFSYAPRLFEGMKSFSSSATVRLPMLTCAAPELFSVSGLFVLYTAVVPVVLIWCVFNVAIVLILRRKRFPDIRDGCVRTMLSFIQLGYLPVIFRVLDTFNCDADPFTNVSYLVSEPYYECGGAEYTRMWSASIALCFLYVFGIPAVIAFILFHTRNRASLSPTQLARYGPFIIPYRIWWYPIFTLTRSILISLIPSLLGAGQPTFVALFVATVIIASLVVNVYFRPFRQHSCNIIEGLGLFSCSVTVVGGVCYSLDKVMDTNAKAADAIDGFILAVAICILLITAAIMLITLARLPAVFKLLHRLTRGASSAFLRRPSFGGGGALSPLSVSAKYSAEKKCATVCPVDDLPEPGHGGSCRDAFAEVPSTEKGENGHYGRTGSKPVFVQPHSPQSGKLRQLDLQ